MLLFCLGGLRFWAADHPAWRESDLAWYNDRGEYLLTGWVSAAPDRLEGMTVYRVSMIELEDPRDPDWQHAERKVEGQAQVRMGADAVWGYGDLLRFTAEPQTPSAGEDFSYRDYLAQENMHTVIYHARQVEKVGEGYGSPLRAALLRFREKARASIFATFPQPEAGLLEGILLGIERDLPESVAQAYRDTGTAHVIAISGFNMAVLAGLMLWAFGRAGGPYWGALISAVFLLLYTLFVDAAPSVLRALLMAVMAAGGHLIGRRQSGLHALFFPAAVICLVNPLLLRNAGFQLSFAATFGLAAFASPMQDWLRSLLETLFSEKAAARFTKPLAEYFFFTLAAQAATLPVIALQFQRVSLSALLANPLVLPAQPPLLVLGGLAALAGMLHPLAGKLLMLFAWPFARYCNEVVTLLAKIRGGSLILHPDFAAAFLVVFVCFVLTFFLRKKLMKFFRSAHMAWILLGLVCLSASLISIFAHRPDGLLHLQLARCGEHGNLILRTPAGAALVLNPRESVDELTAALERDLSLWDFRLDGLLLTTRADAGVLADLAEDIQIGRVQLAPTAWRAEAGAQGMTLPAGVALEKLPPGARVEIEEGLWLTLLAEDSHETAMLLEHGKTRVLIPNGVDFAQIKASAPQALTGLSAILLDERDVSYIPPRVWRQLEPQVILWKDVSLSPFEESVGVDAAQTVQLVSNGEGFCVTADQSSCDILDPLDVEADAP